MTVKTRITLFIVGAGFFSSLLFSVVVFYELIEQPFELLDTLLKEEAYRTATMLVKAQKESDSAFLDSASQEMDRYWIEIYDGNTRKTIFQSNLAKSVKLPLINPGSRAIVGPLVPEAEIKSAQARNKNSSFRIRALSIELDGRSFIVQIARPMEKLNEEIWELVFGILAGLVFSTLGLIAISHVMAGKILRPIGEIKNLAQDISENNLEQRIPPGEGKDEFSELARTINRMLDRLQYSFARQRNFLFDTSHELKTPLTTIRLAVDEIGSLDEANLPPLVRSNLLRLKNQVLRIERLVKDLLNLSSLETLSSIDPKPVQISELLSALAGEYKFLADSRDIKIDIRLPNGLAIQGDEQKLHRALSNILDNAIKYNVDGGQIALRGDLSSAGLTVTVANTGPGVAEADIPRVFDQFYRVEKFRSIEHGGSGLGLSIVKRIVELHGGNVTFESEQGGWTQVTVSLPRYREKILA
jgi:signal transduction histidine kinase